MEITSLLFSILFSIIITGLLVFLIVSLIIRLFQRKPIGTIVRAIVALILFVFGLSMLGPAISMILYPEVLSFGPFDLIIGLVGIVLIGIGFCIFFIPLRRARAERRKPLTEIQWKQQTQIDNQVDTQVRRLYTQYGEEWINNAGRSRLTMAIDEMLGPAPRRDSNAARAQRTLAAAVLETVLARKMETVRQQQGASQEGQQSGIAVDPMLAADIVDTAVALTEDAHYINEVDDVGDIDDTDLDDIDDVDDVDLDID